MTNQPSVIIICANQTERIHQALKSLANPIIKVDKALDIINYQASENIALVILDRIEDCKIIREQDTATPILTITDEIDKALDAGANDCTIFHEKLLLKRVNFFLRESSQAHKSLQTILNAIPDVIVVVNRQGIFTQIISGGKNYSYNLYPTLGKTLSETLRPHIAQKFSHLIQVTLDTQTTQVDDYSFILENTTYYQQVTLSPISRNEVVIIARDISQQKLIELNLKESEQRYRRLFKNATDAIFVIDVMTGNINDASPQAAWMLGYTLDDLINMQIDLIESDEINIRQEEKIVEDTNKLIVETQYKHHDGHYIDVEINSRVIQEGGKLIQISFVRDISEHKQTLAEIEQQRNLAEALLDTANALNQSNDLNTILDKILHNVSRIMPHDSANIMLIEDNSARIIQHLGYDKANINDEAITKIILPLDKTDNLRWVVENQKPLKIDDTHNSIYFKWVDNTTSGYIKSLITAPIIIDNTVIGFINIDSAHISNFTDEQTQYLLAFANQIAIVINQTSLLQKLNDYTEELEQRVSERTKDFMLANKNLKNQIVQRQLIEEKLEEERVLLRTIIDNIPDHIYVKDTEQKLILANQATITDLIPNNQSFDDVFLKSNPEIFGEHGWVQALAKEDKTLLETRQAIINQEFKFKRSDGETRLALVTKIPLIDIQDNVIGFLGINRDITDLKKAQTQLSDERNMLRLIIDTIPDSIYVKNSAHEFILANKASFYNNHKADSESAILGKTDRDFDPEGAETLEKEEQHIMTTGVALLNRSIISNNDDGSIAQLLISKLPLKNSQGKITGIIGLNRNVTELRQAELRLKQVLESARCLLWSATLSKNEDNQFVWDYTIANEDAAQNFLPLNTNNSSYTQAWLNAIPEDQQKKREETFENQLKLGRMNYRIEYCMKLNDGEKHWFSEDVLIERIDEKQLHLVGVCTDISSRKQAETQLRDLNDQLESRVSIRTKELTDEIIEREKAKEAERYQRRVAEAISTGVAKLSSTLDREEIFEHLLNSIQTIVAHDASNIMLLEGDDIVITYAQGYDKDIVGVSYKFSSISSFLFLQENLKPSINNDTKMTKNWQGEEDAPLIRSNLSVPIIMNDTLIGLINLDSKTSHYFTEEHARWLMTFGEQAGIAIRNARYTAELEDRVRERTQDLEFEQAQLKAILNGMTDGVMYTNIKREPYYVNQALVNITGFSQEEWVNGSAQEIMNSGDKEHLSVVWDNILNWLKIHDVWQGEKDFKRKDGSVFDAGMMRTTVRNQNNEIVGIVTVIRDISDEKRLKEQKARFITVAAHELRTPISNMKTRLFLMKRQPKKLDEHMAVTESVVNLMQNLVEHMFDLSRFERGIIKIEPEPINIQTLLSEVLQYQAPQAERQEISINLQMPTEPILISADPFRLTQVIINLIGNAINYTPRQSEVSITVTQLEDAIIISFKDNGSGIDAEHIPNLFQPFYRASDDNKGAGLGLSIVHEIIKAHHGEITVESTLGVGTTFHIRLPLMPPALDNNISE